VDPDGHMAAKLNDSSWGGGGHDVPGTPVCAGHDYDPSTCKPAKRPDIPNDPGSSLSGGESIAPSVMVGMVKEAQEISKILDDVAWQTPDCSYMSTQECQNHYWHLILERATWLCTNDKTDTMACTVQKDLSPNQLGQVHLLLTGLSFLPGVGIGASMVNTLLYLSEGDTVNAILAGSFGAGQVALAGLKFGKVLSGTSKALDDLMAAKIPGVGKASGVSFGHGSRHLAGTALEGSQAEVEAAIVAQVRSAAAPGGSFWGTVVVNGVKVEYRAFELADHTIHIGTYYLPH